MTLKQQARGLAVGAVGKADKEMTNRKTPKGIVTKNLLDALRGADVVTIEKIMSALAENPNILFPNWFYREHAEYKGKEASKKQFQKLRHFYSKYGCDGCSECFQNSIAEILEDFK